MKAAEQTVLSCLTDAELDYLLARSWGKAPAADAQLLSRLEARTGAALPRLAGLLFIALTYEKEAREARREEAPER